MTTLRTVSWLVLLSSTAAFAAQTPVAKERSREVLERGPHHRLWRSVREMQTIDGRSVYQTNQYVELATGMHYLDNGQWLESKEEIEVFQNGAIARKGQHQVIFAANLNSEGAIDLQSPAGKRFRSQIVGLAFTDSKTGQSVLIAGVKDSIGEVVGNEVIYRDAFDGPFKADVRYTYTRAGFEQDVVISEAPPSPLEYGLDPETTRLEVWTEFLDPPVPTTRSRTVRTEGDLQKRRLMVLPDFVDEMLDFEDMHIGSGEAFPLGGKRGESTVPVAKSWLHLDGRHFLVEAVEFSAIDPMLNALPPAAAAFRPPPKDPLQKVLKDRVQLAQALPQPPKSKAEDSAQIRLAGVPLSGPALVLDYQELNGTFTNVTFQALFTYLISGPVNLYGTNLMEAGTVIKFEPGVNAAIDVKGVLRGDTDLYRPVVFTARDDDSMGQPISLDTLTGTYASTALNFDYAVSGQPASLQNIRILYAATAVRFNGGAGHELRHIQIGNSGTAVKSDGAQYAIRNALGWNLTNALTGSGSSTGVWEHATLNGVTNLVTSITGRFTNSLLTAISNTTGLVGASNIVLSSSSGVYKTVGSGYHYLADSSPYRNLGTTNINATLAKELKLRTTFAPLSLTNITANTTLSPQAARDTNQVDVGFHYAPLDFFVCGVTVASNKIVWATNGVAIGVDYSTNEWGFILTNAQFVSIGAPLAFNYVGRAHMAQELSGGNPGQRALFFDANSSAGSRDCVLRLRFTEFSQLQEDGFMLFVGTKFGAIEFTHSRIFNPSLNINTSGGGTLVVGLTNTWWESGGQALGQSFPASGSNVTVHLRNNLIRLASWHFVNGNTNWTVRDNLFDRLWFLDDHGSPVQNSYNAFHFATNGITGGTSNLVLTNLTYEVGLLGKHYQPTNSVLINAGSRTADQAQLYHFTTTTNQALEMASQVDIGLHYVALNGQGQPVDSDADGTPNIYEDLNGNGVVDPGETPYTTVNVSITSPANNTVYNALPSIVIDASASVSNNSISYVEFFQGTNSLGQDATAPYSVTWNNAPGGVHTLTARATAAAGIIATSAPVTIYVYNSLFVVGNTNLSTHDNDVKNRLQTLGFYSVLKSGTGVVSNDANGKQLVVISKTVTSADVTNKLTLVKVPVVCWEDPLLDDLKETGTVDGTDFGSTTAQTSLLIENTNSPMAAGLTGTVTITTTGSEYSWGKPNTNGVRVARLTGSNTNRVGIFGYEGNAMMLSSLEAPARRAGLFMGNISTPNLNSNGWRLFDAAITWATGTNAMPVVNWVAPTNGSTFIASTNITLSADATDHDSGLKKVNFYRNGVRIGQANTISNINYKMVWSNAIAGTHLLSAKAFDQGGIWSTSAQFVAVTILSNALFVTQSTNLNSGETAIRTRLQNMGLVVTTRAATNVTTADALGKTLVLISASAAASNITNKFTTVPTPVVVWQKDLLDDLGMTGTNATNYGITASQTQLTILNSNHVMAAGSHGTVTVLTNSTDISWGRPGSNAVTIASVVGDASKVTIFGYDKGRLMVGLSGAALAAPARRVGFFLSVSNAASLNTNGWALFDAAVRWAMEKSCPDSVDVFLVMDVSQSLTDADFLRSKKSSSNFVNFLTPNMDRVGLVTFAGDVQINSLLTTNGPAVQSLIMGLTERSGTYLHDAIKAAHTNTPINSANIARAMILSSDGIISTNPPGINNSNLAVQAATAAKNAGIRIITIGYGSNADGQGLLKNIASSPEDYIYSPDISEFEDVYASIADSVCRFDEPPLVAITNPTGGQVFAPGSNIPIDVLASDAEGFVTFVEIYVGTNSLKKITNAPYSTIWSNVAEGAYTLTAIAQDNTGLNATSAPVNILVTNYPPTVFMTAPTNGSFFPSPPTNVILVATATDPDGTVTNLAFFAGGIRIDRLVTTNGSTYSLDWHPLFGGTNTITAQATDNLGRTSTSSPITFRVNHPPQVSITAPTNNQIFMAPNNNITIQATASDVEASGSVTNVQLFRDQISLGNDTTAPYSILWSAVPPGTYVLSARATDNHGAQRTSVGITIVVNPTNSPPIVDAGPNQTVRLPEPATLQGTVGDDGLPPGSVLQKWWSKLSGPGTVTFANSNAPGTVATLGTAGTYVLRLTASDSQFTITDDVTITNLPNNEAPVVNAGPDQTLVLAAQVPFASSTNVFFEQFNPDTKGKEFWLAFMKNYDGAKSLTLFITGEKDAWVSVTLTKINFATNVSLTANTIASVNIPLAAEIVQPNETNSLGIHITSNQEVSVYGLSREDFTTDAFVGFPVDILGTNYIVLGYTNLQGAEFAIVATRKSTAITITPTVDTIFSLAGEPFTITLNEGQTFMLHDFTDLTGTLVVSDKPIAVFGGNQCAYVPVGVEACDHLVEQLQPVSAWGRNFATMPLATRLFGDRFRVVAAENNTLVKTNGVNLATIDRAQLFEFVLETATHVTSDKPVMLAQYSHGQLYDGVISDPFMQIVPPYEQFLSAYTVSTPASGFSNQFINVVCPTGIVGQVKLDGTNLLAANFVTIGNSGFAGSQVRITNGSHRLEAPLPFGIHAYGFDWADSYGYPGGMSLSAVANVNAIVLSPNPGTNEINTTRCIFANVTDAAGKPLPGIRVDFKVTGSNNLTGFALSEGTGIARFCYTSSIVGSDVITASSGSITNKATNYWSQPFTYMAGSVSDDGLPLGILNRDWSKTSGPGNITFTPVTATNAHTAVTMPGIYVLRLTANDTERSTFDEMTLTALRNQPPVVSAGPNQTIRSESTVLNGSATDDGLPTAPLSINWAALNPAGIVTFSSTSQPQTTVTFKSPGVYQLRLTASDSQVAISSDVVITNQPDASPIVCTQTVTGTLAATDRHAVGRPGAYADYYRFTAEANQLLVIEMTSTNVDAFLSLYTKDLQLLATDDDSLLTNNAKLICVTPFAGEYYLEASSAFTNQTGSYQVKLNCGAYPFVTITSPTNGTFWADPPGIITVTLDAFDLDGIAYVALYDDFGLVWDWFGPPYETGYWIGDPGIYRFYAHAQDGFGNWSTSSVVVVRAGTAGFSLTPARGCPAIPGFWAHTVTATLTDQYGTIVVGTNVQFTVSGANTTSGNQATDSSGQAWFLYTGLNPGFDTIKATAVIGGVTHQSTLAGMSWSKAIACNQQLLGTLSTNDERTLPYHTYADYYWFNAVSNDQVTVSMRSTNFDTFLSIYNTSCSLIATNDDHNGSDSRISITISNTGTYVIEATSFQPLTLGSYSVEVTCTAPTAQPEIGVFLGTNELFNHDLVDFGVTANGTPIDKVLTITNRGAGNLLVDNVALYGDFSSTNSRTFMVAPGSSANFTVRFNAATNGTHFSFVAFYNNDGDGGDGLERPFILELSAVCNPAGTAPVVTLTAPSSSLVATLPTNIVIAATAVPSGATITHVDFVVRTTQGQFLVGRDTSSPYGMTWNNPPANTYTLTAIALDSVGRSGVSAPITLEVESPPINLNLPFAARDDVTVRANSTDNILNVLANDTDADGDVLRIVEIDVPPVNGVAEVTEDGRAIRYAPEFFIRGSDGLRYIITDGRGGYDDAWVYIAIDASDLPFVTITSPSGGAILTAGTPVTIQASVQPANFVGKVEFFMHDHKLGEDATAPYSISWTPIEDPCGCGIIAIATDQYGQINTSQPVMVTINPPVGDDAPVARILNLTNQVITIPGHTFETTAVVREGLFDLIGDAYDADSSPVKYKIRLFTAERELVRDVTPPPVDGAGFRTGPVTGTSLGILDFTLVENGTYDLELTVRAGFRQSTATVRFGLESELKIGHFSFSEQDLVVPVNGFPITITRTYNSLNLKKGDFGFSWSFAINDLKMELDEEREITESLFEDEGDEEVEPSGQFFSLRVGGGRNVTLTLPDGRRTTFYYYLEAGACQPGDPVSLCATPKWATAPGVFATLRTLTDVRIAVLPSSGGLEWWTDNASSKPENYDFSGFILTTQDGTEYRIEREPKGEKTFLGGTAAGNYANVYGAGKLTQIKQRGGDTINIDAITAGATGNITITHKNPLGQPTRSVVCDRDIEGRIIAISDPLGLDGSGQPSGPPVLKYDYAAGNLIRVHRLVDRATSQYVTTSYTYANTNYPHYITGIIDPRGIQVAKNLYDPSGRLIGIVDADGRTNTFHHDLVARTETITNRLGDRTIHAYDTRGNVVQTIDALGFNTFRGFDTNNNRIYEANHVNQTNWFVYNSNNLLISSTNALGHTNGFVYNSFGQLEISFDAYGRGTTNQYSSSGHLTNTVTPIGTSTAFIYNSQGLLVSEKDATGTLTTNQYDTAGNLSSTSVKNPSGQTLSTTSLAYDANNNLTNQTQLRTLPSGGLESLTTTFVYDGQNRLVHTVEPDGKTNSIVYNMLNQQAMTVDKLGRHTVYEYDGQGRAIKQTLPDGSVRRTVYDAEGRRTNTIDQLGRTTAHAFDKLGRVIATMLPDGSTNRTAYDSAGRVSFTVDFGGKTNAFGYDAVGRRIAVTNAFGTPMQSVTRYALDAIGNVTNVIDALGRAADYDYDSLNRRIKVTFPATVSGGARPFAWTGYDALGRRIAETNEAGVVTRFGYDAVGRLTAVTNGWGTLDAIWSMYAYDEVGNQTNQVDALGRITRFEFDKLGRKTKRVLPGNQNETFTYDPAGNLLSHTEFISSQVITNEYDSMNRLLRRWAGLTLLESYSYALNGLKTARTDASGTYSWGYDSRDRMTVAVTPVGVLNYQYDRNGNLTNLYSATPNGVSVIYQYDALNRVTNVIDKRLGGAQNTAYRFDLAGNLKSLTYPNAVTNLWEYDSRNRLTNEVWKLNTTALGSFFYQLGVAGHRTNLSENVNGTSRTYAWTYDQQYRLTNEVISGLGSLGYRYDVVGNRTNRQSTVTQLPTTTYSYNTNDWLTTDVYDNNGNTRTNGSVVYLYDWANRLTNVNSGNIVIVYNADGQRIRKTVSGVTTLYLVDDHNLTGYTQVLEEHTVSGSITNLAKAYTYGLDLISQRQANGTVHFYGYDGHGSVRFLADSSGTVSDTYTYDAYGTLLVASGSTPNAYRYTGEQFDSDLGFYYLRARYLSANTGRFMTMDGFDGNQPDPISLHKYLYAHADPVNGVDPSGNFTLTEITANIGNILNLATRLYSALHKVYKVKTALEKVQFLFKVVEAIDKATAAQPASFPEALFTALKELLGAQELSAATFMTGFDQMFNAIGPNWDDIVDAIGAKTPQMAGDAATRALTVFPKLATQKNLTLAFDLPSPPIRTWPGIPAIGIPTSKGNIEFRSSKWGGRFLGIQVKTGPADYQTILRIDYWDFQSGPLGSLSVHYHLANESAGSKHPPGQKIWP